MTDREYLSHLYAIASHLNKEFSLPAALRQSLEKTVELLDLETGWIWLTEKDMKSVYLAASYNLPPALKDHPERLSGWCYCIEHYLTDQIEEAKNISEIACSRLRDLTSGTKDLKFHATIPIITKGEKVGLINLLSREKQQLDEKQLSILNTISELIGIAVQRTRLQDAYTKDQTRLGDNTLEVLKRVIETRVDELIDLLTQSKVEKEAMDVGQAMNTLKQARYKSEELREQLDLILNETKGENSQQSSEEFRYPSSPLTPREMEVLVLVQKGFINAQIADQLFIAERTVKFHITSILTKLYAKTRTEAVDIALKRGLISI